MDKYTNIGSALSELIAEAEMKHVKTIALLHIQPKYGSNIEMTPLSGAKMKN